VKETEIPTAKKLRDARKKGQGSKNTDVNSTALLIALCAYVGLDGNITSKRLEIC
jgi:type III secretory pathway component EscU